jgi:hypothetical protein
MSVKVKVRNNKQIIVPLRFGRAVTGATVVDAPDVDDRGFAMGNRPGTWGSTTARGAMVGITAGDTVRIQVRREDIDGQAKLFVTSSDPNIVAVVSPTGALAVDGIFSIKGLVDVISKPVKIQVHMNSATGPVLAEMEPHIFQLRQLRVVAHMVTINGTPPARTVASLTQLFNDVNEIWRAAGIEFLFNPAEVHNDSINGFTTAGTVTTHLSATPPTFVEFSRVINLTPDAHAINVYFVQSANEFTGLTFDHDEPRPSGFGVCLRDNRGDAHALAHEIGHFLDLDIHAGEDTAGHHVRDDVFSERRMMFDFAPLRSAQPAFRNDVGYGNLVPGDMIDLKDFAIDASDGAIAITRRRSLNPF